MKMNQGSQHVAYPWCQFYPDHVKWDFLSPEKNVLSILDQAAELYPDRICADFMDKEWRYKEIANYVNIIANSLITAGLQKGDRIGLFLPNCPYFVIFYFAVLRAGGVVVNFNPLYAKPEIKHQIQDAGVRFMVTLDLKLLYEKLAELLTEKLYEKVIICPMAGILPGVKKFLFRLFKSSQLAKIPSSSDHILWKNLIHKKQKHEFPQIHPDDLAVLQYTGGTTGTPKGAMLTHRNIYSNAEQCRLWLGVSDKQQETMMGVLPFFHVFAMTTVMNLSLMIGARIVMMPRFELKSLLQLCAKKNVTLFPAVPSLYNAINNSKLTSSYDLSSIRLCVSGGAPLPIEVKHRFEEITGCYLIEGYGLTEASPVVAANPIGGKNKEGSIGLPFPGTIVAVADLEDPEKILDQGTKGEILLKGPQIMTGYWQKKAETDNVLRNGWLHTGDVGYIDPEGYIFLIDRIKDLILVNGFNVYPRRVEEALYRHPAVAECIVAGFPDKTRGEIVKAYIVPRKDIAVEEKDLHDFLKGQLSPIERPRSIQFREELPKTMIGKLSRKDLIAQELARAEEEKSHNVS